jgi:hypothetical protein
VVGSGRFVMAWFYIFSGDDYSAYISFSVLKRDRKASDAFCIVM